MHSHDLSKDRCIFTELLYILFQTLSLSYMTGMLSRYTFKLNMWLSFVTLHCVLLIYTQRDDMFLVLIASITPSQSWFVWASQQQSVSWSQSSASKLRWEFFSFLPFIFYLMFCKINSFSCCWINIFWFDLICLLQPVWRDIIPRRALCLLHGHVHLWTGAGLHPSLSICKYDNVNKALTPVVCHVRLGFWGLSRT